MTATVIPLSDVRDARRKADLPERVRLYLSVWARLQDDIATLRQIDPTGEIHPIVSKEWAEAHDEPECLLMQIPPILWFGVRPPAG